MSKLDKEAFDVFFRKVISPALKKEEKSIQLLKSKEEHKKNESKK